MRLRPLIAVVATATLVATASPSSAATNDPLRPQQWGLDQVFAEQAWPTSTGAGSVVAVVDSGVDLDHPDLQGQLVPGVTTVGCGPQQSTCGNGDWVGMDGEAQDLDTHGTHVTGIVAAVGRIVEISPRDLGIRIGIEAGAVVNTIYPEENARRGYRRGWLDSVFTRRSWRRRGVARALIARSFVVLKEQGMTSASLGVDATNPHEAVRLYERVGYRPIPTYEPYVEALPNSICFEKVLVGV